MTTPIFSPTRTEEKLTCGITNIPLTVASRVNFQCDINDVDNIYNIYESFDIKFSRMDNRFLGISLFTSLLPVESKIIKQIWRNFKTFRPRFISDYKYLYWEVDTHDNTIFETVIDVYRFLQLPVYIHKTMQGFHFICVKPIEKERWQFAIQQLRHTNDKYPPITLRIKPNKYVNEEKIFNDGFIMSEKYHADTKQLRDWIVSQNFNKIGEYYQLVWYDMTQNNKELDD